MISFNKWVGIILLFIALAVVIYLYLPPKTRSFKLSMGKRSATIQVVKFSDTRYIVDGIIEGKKFEYPLLYSVFQIDTGDLDTDGRTELLIGGVMPSSNFILPERRLFVYMISENGITPAGPAIVFDKPLVNFRTVYDNGIEVKTLEEEIQGKYTLALYEWNGNGLRMKRYLRKNISKEEGLKELALSQMEN